MLPGLFIVIYLCAYYYYLCTVSFGPAAGCTFFYYWSGISVCPRDMLLVLARERLFVFYCSINVGD